MHSNKKLGVRDNQKIFESLETTARIFGFTKGNVSANINLEFDVIISRENTTVRSKLLYNGEFDPGSG